MSLKSGKAEVRVAVEWFLTVTRVQAKSYQLNPGRTRPGWRLCATGCESRLVEQIAQKVAS